jgi:hypothetical protein
MLHKRVPVTTRWRVVHIRHFRSCKLRMTSHEGCPRKTSLDTMYDRRSRHTGQRTAIDPTKTPTSTGVGNITETPLALHYLDSISLGVGIPGRVARQGV